MLIEYINQPIRKYEYLNMPCDSDKTIVGSIQGQDQDDPKGKKNRNIWCL